MGVGVGHKGLISGPLLCFTLENFHNKNAFLKKVTTETSRLCSQRLTVSARGRCIEGLFAPVGARPWVQRTPLLAFFPPAYCEREN